MIADFSVKFAVVYGQQLLTTLKLHKSFYLAFAGIWLLGIYYQFSYSQFALSIWINNSHTPLLDQVMIALTYAGDGIFVTLVGLGLVMYKRSWFLPVLFCLLIPSLLTQFLKHQVFDDYHRPAVLMEGISGLHFVPGVDINQHNSFPSGHTTAAFSLYALLALLLERKNMGWIWVLIASLVGLSRVYLLQHFWIDVVAGALIGTLMSTFIFVLFKTFYPSK